MPAPRRRRILEEWNSFVSAVYGGIIPNPEQNEQIKRSFFCGALAMHAVVMRGLSPGGDVEDSDLSMMMDISEELKEFGEAIRARRQ